MLLNMHSSSESDIWMKQKISPDAENKPDIAVLSAGG